MSIQSRDCLACGMTACLDPGSIHEPPRPSPRCPKCDGDLLAQSDGSILTEDIAHGRETVAFAMEKMDRVLEEAHAGYSRGARLIIGGGLIREEVLGELEYLRREGRILAYGEDGGNRGAVLVQIRP